MHKIEIVITHPDSESLREILDTVLRHALDVLKLFRGVGVQGVILMNVPEEKEN